jgi:hypothetical protein
MQRTEYSQQNMTKLMNSIKLCDDNWFFILLLTLNKSKHDSLWLTVVSIAHMMMTMFTIRDMIFESKN